MSQTTVPSEAHSPAAQPSPPNEIAYRPVPATAPVTLVLGLFSFVALLTVFGTVLALAGTLVGLVCLWKIRRSDGALGGRLPAWTGFGLSLFFLVTGSGFHAYQYATEVPAGHRRIDFALDISNKGFVVREGAMQPHPDVQALDGDKIFVKGYMYPGRQTEGLQSFVLVKDNRQCCFGGQPSPEDMIVVEMQGERTVDYTQTLVAVAGTFRRREHVVPGQEPVYAIDAIQAGPAKTGF